MNLKIGFLKETRKLLRDANNIWADDESTIRSDTENDEDNEDGAKKVAPKSKPKKKTKTDVKKVVGFGAFHNILFNKH